MATIKSIEEKAKAYDEVVNKLKGFMAQGVDPLITRADAQDFFPELKESDDERIRKDIVFYIAAHHKDDGEKARWLYWLEKQGGHAKFINGIQVGDKVTRNEDGVLVNLSQLNRVAKKQGEQKPADEVGNYDHKEVLQTIINEQKSAWSEEDERNLNYAIDACKAQYGNMSYTSDWLKSLKDRYTWKPSDEQISIIEFVMEDIEKDSIRYTVLNSILEQLKKLKE